MTLDEKRRQKKLAKKAAKRKAKLTSLKPSWSPGGRLSPVQAANYPIQDCLVPEHLFEFGIGNIVLTRSLPSGDFAMAAFLLDVFCLGVKNAFYSVIPAQDYAQQLRQIEASGGGRLERDRVETYYKLLRQLDPKHPNTRFIEQLLYPSRLKTWLRGLLPKHP